MRVTQSVLLSAVIAVSADMFGSFPSTAISGNFASADPISGSTGAAMMTPIELEGEVDSLYTIGPGDFFDLYMEDKVVSVQVSPDGYIGLKQAGIIAVGGLKLGEARKRILEAMAKVFLGKECFVKLAQMKKFRVGVYGAVVSPGQHSVEGGSRLSLVLRGVGGFQGSANADSVLLVRNGDTTLLRYAQSELLGIRDGDPLLQQGDLVLVSEYPPTAKLVLVRLAGKGRTLPWVEGMSADKYIQRSLLLRNSKEAYSHLHIQDISTNKARRVLMSDVGTVFPKPNELIEPVIDAGQVFIGGAVARLGSMQYNPHWTPYEYVANSGLTYISAKYGSFRVIHKDGREEWMDPVKGVIEPGDYIDIPRSAYEETKDVTLFLASIISVLSTTILVYVTWKTSGK